MFAELLTGHTLFPGHDEMDMVHRFTDLLGFPTSANMPGCDKLDKYRWGAPPAGAGDWGWG